MKAMLAIGHVCNNSCMGCPFAESGLSLGIDEIKSAFENMQSAGIKEVLIYGGEPLIRKDIMEIAGLARNLGLKLEVETNGRMLYYMDFVDRIKGLFSKLHVRAYANKRSIHEYITRTAGSWEQTMFGVVNAMERGMDISIKLVALQENCAMLRDTAELFSRIGIKGFELENRSADEECIKREIEKIRELGINLSEFKPVHNVAFVGDKSHEPYEMRKA